MNSTNNDDDTYETYRIFPDNVRRLRFGNLAENRSTFYADKINIEPFVYIKQEVINNITSNIESCIKHRTSSPFDLSSSLDLVDIEARNTCHEIKELYRGLDISLPDLNWLEYMSWQYIDVDVNAIAKHVDELVNGITITISIKPKGGINNNSKSVGTRYITLPHVDKTKTQKLDDFSFIYGREQCTYNFPSGRSITINTSDKQGGVQAINSLMKAVVDPMKRRVKSKDLVFKTLEKHSLEGIRGTFTNLVVVQGEAE